MRKIDAEPVIAQLVERRDKYTKWMNEFEKQGKRYDQKWCELNMQLFEVNVFIQMLKNAPEIKTDN